MAIDPEFAELMNDYITVYPPAARDAYGKRTFATVGTMLRGYLNQAVKVTQDGDGRTEVNGGSFTCFGVAAVEADWKMRLADGTTPHVTAVNQFNDEAGPHHTVIEFGRAA